MIKGGCIGMGMRQDDADRTKWGVVGPLFAAICMGVWRRNVSNTSINRIRVGANVLVLDIIVKDVGGHSSEV